MVIAFETARQLGCLAGFAEERDGKRVVARGFNIKSKKILVVDDVLTTGKSILETIDAVKSNDGVLVGVAVLIDRSSTKLSFEYFSPYKKTVENFLPDQCPLCKSGIALTKLGGL